MAKTPYKTWTRRGGLGLLFALSALVLFETPWRSRFALRPSAVCELAAPLERWLSGAANFQHLMSYGLLAVIAASVLRRRPLLSAASLVLALSAIVELQQSVFTVGHCRLRDMLPNLLAVGVATAISCGISRVRSRADRMRPATDSDR